MAGTRKIAAILVADIVGYSRLAGADEDRTLSRLRGLRSDLIDPAIDAHHGRIVKRTGDGSLIEFRSVVDAVRCAIEVQNGLIERNAGLPPERRIEFRVGIHLGDVVEEADGDLMGDGVNIAARLESICEPGAICLSEQAYWQVKGRLELAVTDLGPTQLKNIAEPVRVAGGARYLQSLPQCGQCRRPIAVSGQTFGQERQTIRQKASAPEPGPVRHALAYAGDAFLDRTLSEQSHAAQHAGFVDQREPLLRRQCLGGFDLAQGSLGLAAIEVNHRGNS